MSSGSVRGNWRVVTAAAAAVAVAVALGGGCSGGSGSTGDAGGPDGTTISCGNSTLCSGSCVDLKNDNANCGACGTACPSGEVCSQGKCGASCGGGTTLCGSSCADTKNDPNNCGGCAKKCGSGEVCSRGACGNTCASGQTFCGGDGGTPYCASTKTDNANCGGCGVTCGVGQVCVSGACASSCGGDVPDGGDAGAETLCAPDGGTPYCANTASDNQNCGGCGITCGAQQTCAGGQCQSSCVQGQTLCIPDAGTPYCANEQTDNANCGGCGVTCTGNTPSCRSGVCGSTDSDLVLYYSFDETTGDAIDRSTPLVNQTNGTFTGLVVRTSGGALNSSGALHSPLNSTAADYLAINGNIDKLNMTTAYSVMAWVKVVDATGGQVIVGLGSCCNTREGYTLNLQPNGTLRFWGGWDTTNTNFNAYDNTNLVDSTWHHVGYRMDSAGIDFLIDGNVTSTSAVQNLPTSPSLADPANNDGTSHLPQIGGEGVDNITGADVYIDEVRVYRRKLSNADWTSAMNGTL